jgi:hypothetical protein
MRKTDGSLWTDEIGPLKLTPCVSEMGWDSPSASCIGVSEQSFAKITKKDRPASQ